LLRGIGCLFALLLIILAGLAIFYFAVVAPRERARQAEVERRAAAFARLRGPARQLAIYDAFVAAVDEHYYDRTFAGFDWPRLKREWRPKAAAAPDDMHLYGDVFFQMAQLFPISHVGVAMSSGKPGAAVVKPRSSWFLSDDDVGLQIASIRRGKSVRLIVGEVWPGSTAANVGVQPGAVAVSISKTLKPNREGRVDLDLLCLTPGESHLVETQPAFTIPLPPSTRACQTGPDPGGSTSPTASITACRGQTLSSGALPPARSTSASTSSRSPRSTK
jgi:hypothetical protein